MTLYNHARDNAIASLGKIIRYQNSFVTSDQGMASQLVAYWVGLLPITHDIEEGQAQYEFLSDFLLSKPEFIFSGDPASTAVQLAKIFGEAFQDKYFAKDTDQKNKQKQAILYLLNSAPAPIPDAFKDACQN